MTPVFTLRETEDGLWLHHLETNISVNLGDPDQAREVMARHLEEVDFGEK